MPELLRALAIKGCVVTTDALNCQKEIAADVRRRGADYVLALKGNHGSLHERVEQCLWSVRELGAADVSAFVSHLAVERKVAASTQSQALSALLFLYREVLALPIGWVDDVERAKKPKRLLVVFTREEVRAVLSHLRDEAWLMASLLYGSGLRLMECVRLRVKDLDLAQLQLTMRDGKGGKDRITVLPASLTEPLGRQLERARALHELDLRVEFGRVHLPYTLARKYPNADWDCAGSTSSRPATAPSIRGRGVSSATTSRRLRYRKW